MNESGNYLSLSQLATIIKDIVSQVFKQPIWVRAEISELHEKHNGHCYLELVEKDAIENKIVARFRGIIWDGTYRMLKPYFESATGQQLRAGLKVLINVKVEYNELYGYSLIIFDIDPTYTLGDLEQNRAMIIQQLVAEGVFDMNKSLPFPLVPQRIAVISSETAAGYEDFYKQLVYNSFGFTFKITLFKAYMQGDQAEQSIIEAMENIPYNEYDVLVITRGGGSRSDLACFDSYNLANNVCQYPIPVIVAIGHERDVSILDMVANVRVKTPTAAAAFILDKMVDYWNTVLNLYNNVCVLSKDIISQELSQIYLIKKSINNINTTLFYKKELFNELGKKINIYIKKVFYKEFEKLIFSTKTLKVLSTQFLRKEKSKIEEENKNLRKTLKTTLKVNNTELEKYNEIVNLFSLENLLKKGFSLTLYKGKVLKNTESLNKGEEIETILSKGKIKSIITFTE